MRGGRGVVKRVADSRGITKNIAGVKHPSPSSSSSPPSFYCTFFGMLYPSLADGSVTMATGEMLFSLAGWNYALCRSPRCFCSEPGGVGGWVAEPLNNNLEATPHPSVRLCLPPCLYLYHPHVFPTSLSDYAALLFPRFILRI